MYEYAVRIQKAYERIALESIAWSFVMLTRYKNTC